MLDRPRADAADAPGQTTNPSRRRDCRHLCWLHPAAAVSGLRAILAAFGAVRSTGAITAALGAVRNASAVTAAGPVARAGTVTATISRPIPAPWFDATPAVRRGRENPSGSKRRPSDCCSRSVAEH